MKSAATTLQDNIVDQTVASLSKGRDVAIDAPTGAGKSRMFSKVIERTTDQQNHALVLSERQNLAYQAAANIKKWTRGDITTSIGIDGNFDQSGQVVSTTVQTANLHLDDMASYKILVIDEAHHALDKNDDYTRVINKALEVNPDIRIVGASATFPEEMKGMIDQLVKADRHVITFEEAIEAKLIDLPETKMDKTRLKNGKTIEEMVIESEHTGHGSKITGVTAEIRKNLPDDWVDKMAWNYSKEFSEVQTLSYLDNIKDANAFVKELSEYGIEVEAVHSKRSAKDNKEAFARFERGEIKGLVTVDMVSEGYDVDARGIFLGKISTSEREFKQINGRGARSYGEEKSSKTLLYDMGASTMLHGNISAQANINNLAKNIASTSRQTMDLSPGSPESAAYWKQIKGTNMYAAVINNSVVYVEKTKDGYNAVQTVKDKKGARAQLLAIEGERKGRPTFNAFKTWCEVSFRKSERSIARVSSQTGGIDGLIAEDWKRNENSVKQNMAMMSKAMPIQQPGLGR